LEYNIKIGFKEREWEVVERINVAQVTEKRWAPLNNEICSFAFHGILADSSIDNQLSASR
jgi:hypothetical protein